MLRLTSIIFPRWLGLRMLFFVFSCRNVKVISHHFISVHICSRLAWRFSCILEKNPCASLVTLTPTLPTISLHLRAAFLAYCPELLLPGNHYYRAENALLSTHSARVACSFFAPTDFGVLTCHLDNFTINWCKFFCLTSVYTQSRGGALRSYRYNAYLACLVCYCHTIDDGACRGFPFTVWSTILGDLVSILTLEGGNRNAGYGKSS